MAQPVPIPYRLAIVMPGSRATARRVRQADDQTVLNLLLVDWLQQDCAIAELTVDK